MVIRTLRLGESGFEFARSGVPSPLGDGQSLYLFNHNGPSNFIDSDGLGAIAIPIPIDIPPVIVENPIGAAFCGGAAIGAVLCYAFPNVMTKPGQWIGDLASPSERAHGN